MNKISRIFLSFMLAFISCFALFMVISFCEKKENNFQASAVEENKIQIFASSYSEENQEHTHKSKNPADCKHKQVCDICGEEFGELGDHKIVTDYYQAPTCTKDGLSPGSHCSICGKIIVAQKVISKKGHTVVIDEEEVPATCESFGQTSVSHCSVCGEILTKQTQIPKTPHIDDNHDGKCDVCGNKIAEIISDEQEQAKMPVQDIVLIVLSVVGFVVIFALVVVILKPKKKKIN